MPRWWLLVGPVLNFEAPMTCVAHVCLGRGRHGPEGVAGQGEGVPEGGELGRGSSCLDVPVQEWAWAHKEASVCVSELTCRWCRALAPLQALLAGPQFPHWCYCGEPGAPGTRTRSWQVGACPACSRVFALPGKVPVTSVDPKDNPGAAST